jgi:hypothetical protein
MGPMASDVIFRTVRWLILHLSDRSLARICRLGGRLAYAFTGDEFLQGVLGEVVDIFESGAPGTELIRKMFREVHGPYAADMLQGFLGL